MNPSGGEADTSARIGELHRVREEVVEDLLEPEGIGDHSGQALLDLQLHPHPPAYGLRPHLADRGLQGRPYGEDLGLHLDLSRLDLGDVEDVVDEGEEVSPAGVHVADVALLPFVQGTEVLVLKELGKADDGVQGGPEFVAHIGQEDRLVARGIFGDAQGFLKPRVEGFQVAGALLDFGLALERRQSHLLVQAGILHGGPNLVADRGQQIDLGGREPTLAVA